jgi:hypothetical protein
VLRVPRKPVGEPVLRDAVMLKGYRADDVIE